MRRRWTWLALAAPLALAGGAIAAQEEVPPAEAAQGSLEERIEAVKERFDAAYAEFSKAYGAAETDEERDRAFEEHFPDADEYARELIELAEAHPQDPARADGWLWVLQRADDVDLKLRAARGLVGGFPELEGLGLSLRSLPAAPSAIALMREAARSEHAALAGSATFVLATKLLEQERFARMLKAVEDEDERRSFEQYLGAEGFAALLAADPAKLESEAEGLLTKVVETPGWAAIDYYGRGTLGPKAESALFELRHLAVGKPAPDIEGEDVDGVAFKLSDYRGKVVFLDFWGHW